MPNHPLSEKPFLDIQPKCPSTQLHGIVIHSHIKMLVSTVQLLCYRNNEKHLVTTQ